MRTLALLLLLSIPDRPLSEFRTTAQENERRWKEVCEKDRRDKAAFEALSPAAKEVWLDSIFVFRNHLTTE